MGYVCVCVLGREEVGKGHGIEEILPELLPLTAILYVWILRTGQIMSNLLKRERTERSVETEGQEKP